MNPQISVLSMLATGTAGDLLSFNKKELIDRRTIDLNIYQAIVYHNRVPIFPMYKGISGASGPCKHLQILDFLAKINYLLMRIYPFSLEFR